MPFVLVLLALVLASCSKQEESAYVNPRTCEGCHAQIALSYRQTGMAQAFHKISPDEVPTSSYTHPKSGFTYTFLQKDGKVYLRRTEGNNENPLEKEIQYVLGSGNHARSFIHRTPEGRLLEMPVNWYPENGGTVAMSPGYDRPDHMDMRRAIGYQCAFCHNGYMKAKGTSLLDDPVFEGDLPEGIDCQRCHGPGREHVSQGGRGKILNPKKLSGARQMEVCMQCHLETTSFPLPNSIVRYDRNIFSYSPAELLGDYIQHFDNDRKDKFEIAGSAYRLRQSKCFLNSGDKLTCTTCHDPHKKTASVDASCQSCHASGPHPERANCASCHMPKRRTEDVIHVAVTDHKIQRPDPKANLMTAREERHEVMGKDSFQGEVKPYYPVQPDNDLYPALAQVLHQSNLKAGIPRLEKAIESNQPKHPAFRLHLAQALHANGQPDQALAQYTKALELDQKFLPAQRSLGATQRQLGRLNEAKQTLEKATADHPGDSLAWLELAKVHHANNDRNAALEAARKAVTLEPELVEAHKLVAALSGDEASLRRLLQLDPRESEGRANLARILADKGDIAGAIAQLDYAIKIDPAARIPHFNYAVLLAGQKRFAEAIPHAKQALAADPKILETYELLGNLFMGTRDFREASATYRQALALAPRNGRLMLGAAMAAGALNDFTATRKYLTQAAATDDPQVRQEATQLLSTLPR